jgi:hypothetical protein
MLATLRARLAAAMTLPECLPCWRATARLVRPLEARLSISTVGRSECDTTTDSTERMCAGSPRGSCVERLCEKARRRKSERTEAEETQAAQKPFRGGLCSGSEVIRWFAAGSGGVGRRTMQACQGSRDAKGTEDLTWAALESHDGRPASSSASTCLTQGSRLTGPSPSTTGPPNHHCTLDCLDARIGAAPPRAGKQPHICPEHDRCRCWRADDKTSADQDALQLRSPHSTR